jgi:hypothetical protein
MDTRRLDLLLLAGCSCLLTLLYQPIAWAIAVPQIGVYPNAEQSVVESSVPMVRATYGDFTPLVTLVP